MSQYDTVDNILNRVGIELGFAESIDPLTDTNKGYVQLRGLMNSAADELMDMFNWSELIKEHNFTTVLGDSDYALPNDFRRMISQTYWDRTNDNPVFGPLSPQKWQYLKGRDLADSSIYVSFRLKQREMHIFPDDPVIADLDIYFEYVSDNWLQDASVSSTFYNEINAGDNICLFPKTIMIKFLKVKWLEAKGFDSSKAREDFAVNFFTSTGASQDAPILNAGGKRGYPYIDIDRNLPDSGYGGA